MLNPEQLTKLAAHLQKRFPQSSFRFNPENNMIEAMADGALCFLFAIDDLLQYHPFNLDGSRPLTFGQAKRIGEVCMAIEQFLLPTEPSSLSTARSL